MNIRFKNKWLMPSMLSLAIAQTAQAAAPGSEAAIMGYMSIAENGIQSNTEETLYIGPGTYEINGIWEVYAKYIVVDPAAVISGTGTIKIYNPSEGGGAASRTYIDGNASAHAIEVNIELHNASGMELFDKDFPADLTGADFSNNAASSAYIGKDLNLMVDGADIWLDADAVGDLRFDNNAAISNYSVNRMIITNNSIISHVVRDAGSAGFFFPVGIADGDYTPAEILGANGYNVSVQNYAGSASVEAAFQEGMDRTWHIFGGTAASVMLQHNSPGTDGTAYTDADAFITRYQSGGTWSTGTIGVEQSSAGVHTNTSSVGSGIPASGGADASYLTKVSKEDAPPPIQLTGFEVYKKGNAAELIWATASEQNNKGFEVERSTDGRTFTKIGFVKSQSENGNSNIKSDYGFTDNNPANGQNFYRLKQSDFDGKYDYSDVRMVTFEAKNAVSIYPNPAKESVTISGLQGGESIMVYDVSGRLMYQTQAGKTIETLDVSKTTSGVYYLRITTAGGVSSSHKLVVE